MIRIVVHSIGQVFHTGCGNSPLQTSLTGVQIEPSRAGPTGRNLARCGGSCWQYGRAPIGSKTITYERSWMPQSMITTEAVARRAGCTGETVRAAVRRGELPAYRIGRALRYDPDEVEEWLTRCRAAAIVADGRVTDCA